MARILSWRRIGPCLALVGGVAMAGAALAQAPWPEEFPNPRPAERDFLLPMPCGAAMAFRPVETPSGPGALEDRPVTLGTTDPAGGIAEFARREAVAGPFAAPGRDVALYWIGKYEVTRDQYAAVMEERCPTPSPAGRLPAASLSWFDAVAFTQRYTTWLLRNAAARLPQADGTPAFVRLPTEEEWEYAARGGAAVSELDFLGRTFPMPEGTARYAWFQGPRSAAGRAQPIGMLEPNPLGLHDMLGNVGELVLEPFRAVRVGRLHGQAGGVVVKGGDYRTPEAALRSSLRIEVPPYDATDGQPTRLASVGFRVVLAAHVTTSLRRAEALNRAFEAESRASGTEAENARRQIAALREGASPQLRQGLDRLEAGLMAAERQRLEDGVIYHEHDWMDLPLDCPAQTPALIYFDDHVDQWRRIREAAARGFRYLVFDDSLPSTALHNDGSAAAPTVDMLFETDIADGEEIRWRTECGPFSYRYDAAQAAATRALIRHYVRLPDLRFIFGFSPANLVLIVLR